jgi:PAS domain S-box-containing protein
VTLEGPEAIAPMQAPMSASEYVDALAQTGVTMGCVLDRHGRILIFDEGCERATGFTAAEVVGRDAREMVIPPEEAEAFGAFLAEVWETRQSSPQVGHWLTRAGERRLIAWSNRPVLDSDGEVLNLFTAGIDLTERERAIGELKALHEQLEERAGALSELAAEQSALRRVATLVAAEATPRLIFDTVSSEVARLVGADGGAVMRFEEERAVFAGRWNADPERAAYPDVAWIPLDLDSATARVYRRGEAARIESYAELAGDVGEAMLTHGYRCSAAAPVAVAGELWGAIVVAGADESALPSGTTERRLAAFAELVALALANAHAREQLLASRARIVQVADEERRRLERDLHDGAQQRLVSLAQRLYLARRRLVEDPAEAAEHLETATAEVREALEDLRRVAHGLHPPILTQSGLGPALAALARRSHLPVALDGVPEERVDPAVETAVYYLVSEALTNAAKHAGATSVRVELRLRDGCLAVEVRDDGVGGATLADGSGLRGLTDRVEALGGTLTLTSVPRRGTTVRAELPLSGARPDQAGATARPAT